MFGFLKKNKKQKVAILGIDGTPCSLLRDLMQAGTMPNLSSLAKTGTLSPMSASIPEVSSTSWTTFMTGVNPGKHSIYGFMELKPGTYELYFPNSNSITSPTLWNILTKHGNKSIVLNVPSTYPAQPLNGILTAGFVAIDLRKATYPESAYEYLNSINYRMDVDTQKAKQSLELFSEDVLSTFSKRSEAILHFLKEEDWDLFIGTVTETDRLHHFMWDAYEQKENKLHNFFIDFYRRVDALIGEIASFCNDIPFFIISDHGFTSIKHEVYINYWLRERGYLTFTKESPDSLEQIGSGTKAFALDPARIYINLKGKYPLGNIESGSEYEDLRIKIREELLALEIEGSKVVRDIYTKEELYKGTYTDRAPDLVAVGNHGYDLKGVLNKKSLFGRSIFTGAHTQDNATFFINRSVNDGNIHIMDVSPTVLKLMGIQYEIFDGKPLI
jgi:predicted AlkP superfamily phosphohydrolase/phosphomutase